MNFFEYQLGVVAMHKRNAIEHTIHSEKPSISPGFYQFERSLGSDLKEVQNVELGTDPLLFSLSTEILEGTELREIHRLDSALTCDPPWFSTSSLVLHSDGSMLKREVRAEKSRDIPIWTMCDRRFFSRNTVDVEVCGTYLIHSNSFLGNSANIIGIERLGEHVSPMTVDISETNFPLILSEDLELEAFGERDPVIRVTSTSGSAITDAEFVQRYSIPELLGVCTGFSKVLASGLPRISLHPIRVLVDEEIWKDEN